MQENCRNRERGVWKRKLQQRREVLSKSATVIARCRSISLVKVVEGTMNGELLQIEGLVLKPRLFETQCDRLRPAKWVIQYVPHTFNKITAYLGNCLRSEWIPVFRSNCSLRRNSFKMEAYKMVNASISFHLKRFLPAIQLLQLCKSMEKLWSRQKVDEWEKKMEKSKQGHREWRRVIKSAAAWQEKTLLLTPMLN